jgi:amino acid adenylation domain-containing protein
MPDRPGLPGRLIEDQRSLRSGFLGSLARFPDRPAIRLKDDSLTYRQLADRAAAIAATLQREIPEDPGKLTAIYGHRSFTAFAGILGALLRGHGYVPLNPIFPVDRSRGMLVRSEVRGLVVAPDGLGQLGELLDGADGKLIVVVPEADDAGLATVAALAAKYPQHRFVGPSALATADDLQRNAVDPDAVAYLLFTSGSTGQPKGVMVAHRNAVPFMDAMVERYGVDENDRFSQTFDLTFDLSVFDQFVCWQVGACLCVPTANEKMLPGKWAKKNELTVWFSVPSTAVLMNRLRVLKAGAFPSFKWSLFCGEGLPIEVASAFAAAAPNSKVENLYGPTELTIACTLYRYDPVRSLPDCELGLVPIGDPYPGMKVLVADDKLNEVPPGETGELLMAGPQLTLGYWRDPEKTAKAFVKPPGKDEIYYRTGDRVRRSDGARPMVYLGRIDNQIKVQGYRVELGEIESVVRKVGGVDVAVAVGWPQVPTGADGIVVFVSSANADLDHIRETSKEHLPSYMHPSRVLNVGTFPLNANGKIDRKALLAQLASEPPGTTP